MKKVVILELLLITVLTIGGCATTPVIPGARFLRFWNPQNNRVVMQMTFSDGYKCREYYDNFMYNVKKREDPSDKEFIKNIWCSLGSESKSLSYAADIKQTWLWITWNIGLETESEKDCTIFTESLRPDFGWEIMRKCYKK